MKKFLKCKKRKIFDNKHTIYMGKNVHKNIYI